MSLEATHIRFALDLEKRLNVQDRQKYVVGTVYPDSRYVSGIDRNLTHYNDLLDELKGTDDFAKGMAVHLLCDRISAEIRDEWFDMPEKTTWGGDYWVYSTALKIIQDTHDFEKFDLNAMLPLLDYSETRNDEQEQDIIRYNTGIQKTYAGKSQVTLSDEMFFWNVLGLD